MHQWSVINDSFISRTKMKTSIWGSIDRKLIGFLVHTSSHTYTHKYTYMQTYTYVCTHIMHICTYGDAYIYVSGYLYIFYESS